MRNGGLIRTAFVAVINVGDVGGTAARLRIGRATARTGLSVTTVNAARRQTASMYGLGQDSSNLLGKRSMLGCGPATQRLLEFVRHVSTNENSFAICHLYVSPSEL